MTLPLIPTYVRRMLVWIGVPAVACGLMFFVYERAPPYSFSAFCTYDLTYRLNVTIEVGGCNIRRRSYVSNLARANGSKRLITMVVRKHMGVLYHSASLTIGSFSWLPASVIRRNVQLQEIERLRPEIFQRQCRSIER